jgi:hypothetical protein
MSIRAVRYVWKRLANTNRRYGHRSEAAGEADDSPYKVRWKPYKAYHDTISCIEQIF